jgi:hypothetical protein
MAYLSEENQEMYRRMLSADDERGPVQSGLFNPPPKTAAPSVFVKRGVGKPVGPMAVKGITVTGVVKSAADSNFNRTLTMQEAADLIEGKGIVGPKPFDTGPVNPTLPKSNLMPLVYIGGAGLLLYYLLKK